MLKELNKKAFENDEQDDDEFETLDDSQPSSKHQKDKSKRKKGRFTYICVSTFGNDNDLENEDKWDSFREWTSLTREEKDKIKKEVKSEFSKVRQELKQEFSSTKRFLDNSMYDIDEIYDEIKDEFTDVPKAFRNKAIARQILKKVLHKIDENLKDEKDEKD